MEKHQLLYVVTVSKCGSFTQAAEQLNITQSSLSAQIIKLENQFNLKLFVRKPHHVTLTEAGKEFVKYAQQILVRFDCLEDLMVEYSKKRKGKIRIGVLSSVMNSIGLPKIIRDFINKNPEINISITEKFGNHLLKLLQAYEIDAAFLFITDPKDKSLIPNMNFDLLNQENLVAVISEEHPYSQETEVSLDILLKENIILVNENFQLHLMLRDYCNNHGLSLNVRCNCTQVDSCINLVSQNLGITFCTESIAMRYHLQNCRTVKTNPAMALPLYLVSPKEHALLPAVQTFRKFILDQCVF